MERGVGMSTEPIDSGAPASSSVRPDGGDQPIVVLSDSAACEAQSISGEGATPKTTVAAAQSSAEPTINPQRLAPLGTAFVPGAPPAMAGIAPGSAAGGSRVGSGRLQTAATTRGK